MKPLLMAIPGCLTIFGRLMDDSGPRLRGAFDICAKWSVKAGHNTPERIRVYLRGTENSGITREAGLNQTGNNIWPSPISIVTK